MDGLCRDHVGNEKAARLITPKISTIRARFLMAEGGKEKKEKKAAGIGSSGIIFAEKKREGLLTAQLPNFGGNCYLMVAEKLPF